MSQSVGSTLILLISSKFIGLIFSLRPLDVQAEVSAALFL